QSPDRAISPDLPAIRRHSAPGARSSSRGGRSDRIGRWAFGFGRRLVPGAQGQAPRARSSSRSGLTARVDYNHNVGLIMLGEFENLLLSVAARLGDQAYGAAIRIAL